MKVTDKKVHLDKLLLQKLDLMIKRSSGKKKFDNLVIIDGDEGYGKSNLAAGVGYYIAYKMKRPWGIGNWFFDIDKLTEFIQSTKEQVIIWDEAALAGLASDWQNKYQRMLIRLMMVARKRRHIYIFNVPKFYRLHEYLAIERSIALIHVYARNELELGRFAYFKRSSKELLYYDWKKKHHRSYKKFYNFSGTFNEALPHVVDEDEYDRKKDEAINAVNVKPQTSKTELKLMRLQYLISQQKGDLRRNTAKHFNVHPETVLNWSKLPKKYPQILENEEKIEFRMTNYNYLKGKDISDKNPTLPPQSEPSSSPDNTQTSPDLPLLIGHTTPQTTDQWPDLRTK